MWHVGPCNTATSCCSLLWHLPLALLRFCMSGHWAAAAAPMYCPGGQHSPAGGGADCGAALQGQRLCAGPRNVSCAAGGCCCSCFRCCRCMGGCPYRPLPLHDQAAALRFAPHACRRTSCRAAACIAELLPSRLVPMRHMQHEQPFGPRPEVCVSAGGSAAPVWQPHACKLAFTSQLVSVASP